MTALCPRHPGEVAEAACARCGTFLCRRCLVDTQAKTCAECDIARYSARENVGNARRLLVFIFAGVGLLGFSALQFWSQFSEGIFYASRLAIGILSGVFGAALVGGGIIQRIRLGRIETTEDLTPPPPMVYPELTEQEVSRQLARGEPFSVCLRCRVVFEALVVQRCLRCDLAADCLEISSADDARMMLAALE